MLFLFTEIWFTFPLDIMIKLRPGRLSMILKWFKNYLNYMQISTTLWELFKHYSKLLESYIFETVELTFSLSHQRSLYPNIEVTHSTYERWWAPIKNLRTRPLLNFGFMAVNDIQQDATAKLWHFLFFWVLNS